jgi:hypothetical protein
VNGGGFTDISSTISPNTTYTQFSYDLNNASDNIIVRIQQTAGERLLFDDASIADYSAPSCSSYSHALYNRGAPVYSYYLGDNLAYQFEFAVNQDTTGWTVDYGLGSTTDGSGWTWYGASWSRMDGANNRVWISDQNEHRFTSTGNFYYAGRFTTGSCAYYADVDWEPRRRGLSAGSYVTVNPLNDPGTQSRPAAPAR